MNYVQKYKFSIIKLRLFTAGCQCEQLRKQVTQLKLNLADGNAKITGLELQIQNDYKKRVQDLEKSLDQAKHKVI